MSSVQRIPTVPAARDMAITAQRRAAYQRHGPAGHGARALAWFGIALGVAQLVMPRALARISGLGGVAPAWMRACALREIGTGVGLLRSAEKAPWAWARVAGDALDAAALSGAALDPRNPRAHRSAIALAGVMACTAADVAAARGLTRGPRRAVHDYSDRSGLGGTVAELRGAARRGSALPPLVSPAVPVSPTIPQP